MVWPLKVEKDHEDGSYHGYRVHTKIRIDLDSCHWLQNLMTPSFRWFEQDLCTFVGLFANFEQLHLNLDAQFGLFHPQIQS